LFLKKQNFYLLQLMQRRKETRDMTLAEAQWSLESTARLVRGRFSEACRPSILSLGWFLLTSRLG